MILKTDTAELVQAVLDSTTLIKHGRWNAEPDPIDIILESGEHVERVGVKLRIDLCYAASISGEPAILPGQYDVPMGTEMVGLIFKRTI